MHVIARLRKVLLIMRFLREMFAERLKNLFDNSGLKKGKIAELLDVDPPQITRWCHGDTYPSEENFNKIKKHFNVDESYFVAGNDDSVVLQGKLNSTLEFFRKKLEEKDQEIQNTAKNNKKLTEAEVSLLKAFHSLKDPEKAMNLFAIFSSLGYLQDHVDLLDDKLIVGDRDKQSTKKTGHVEGFSVLSRLK